MIGVFDVPMALLPGWTYRGAELWSWLGLAHRYLLFTRKQLPCPSSEACGGSGWYSACILALQAASVWRLGNLIHPSQSSLSSHTGVDFGRIFVIFRSELHLWGFLPSSGDLSPCLGFPWEAIEGSLATSRLGILFWLSLLFSVWSWVNKETSPASAVSSLIIETIVPLMKWLL